MKQLKYILSTFVLLIPVLIHAQTETPLPIYSTHQYNRQNGIATGKSVSAPDEDGIYTLTLETFATGVRSIVSKSIPSDIVLMLDYSSSMLTNDNITKLKQAVVTFVGQMQANNAELHLEPGQMGNRIAFVLYAGLLYDDYPETTQRANTSNACLVNDYPYFNAKYVNNFIEVADLTANGTSVLYNNVNIISPSSQHDSHPAYLGGNNFGDTNKGTNTPAAMEKALELVTANQAQYSPSARGTTVVLFTDGEPCNIYQQWYQGQNNAGSSGFSAAYANACLADAESIKDKGVKIFTVGLFNYNGNNNQANRQTRTFVELNSSNFPDFEAPTATNWWTNNSNLFNIDDEMSGDYCSIVSSGVDLDGVFSTIAEASGGSTSTVPGETQIVDAVSSSFEVPSDFEASDVVVYTRSINAAGNDWEKREDLSTVILPSNFVLDALPPEDAVYMTDEKKVGVYLNNGKLVILGFNYSKADSDGADGSTDHPYDGNWVGWREGDQDAAGKELVVEFNVEAIKGVTGGDGTNTNSPESGVLVPQFDEETGEFIGYQNMNKYPYPQTDLPVNIEIHKEGLMHGESATIQIYRAKQKVGVFDETTGKPAPDLTNGWENFTKVILTNKEDDGETVIKKLVSLDPSYVYRLEEDNWGFSYKLDTYVIDTSQKEANPFVFANTKKATGTETTETTVVKHAEAVSINHFNQSDPDKRVENYKSNEKFDKK